MLTSESEDEEADTRARDDSGPVSHFSVREDSELLLQLFQEWTDAVCLSRLDARGELSVVFVNRAFCQLTGFAPAELVGRPSGFYLRNVQLPQEVRRITAAGQTNPLDVTCTRSDGSSFSASWRLLPLHKTTGPVEYVAEVLRDVTEEKERQERAELFRCAVEHSPDVFLMVDEHGSIVHANQESLRVLGGELTELEGRKVSSFESFRLRSRTYRRIVSTTLRKGQWRGTVELRLDRDEPRALMVSVAYHRSVSGKVGFIIEARDITHHRRLEYIAEAANLAENVGYVFAGLRHELGNPVNSIKTALSFVRDGLGELPAERVKAYLDSVLVEVGRVEYLLRSMATFNRTQQPVIERLKVVPFLMAFARIIRPDADRRGVRLVVRAPGEECTMFADPQALHQVLLNLVTNALDALEGSSGGTIRISVTERGKHVDLIVSDDGRGVPENQIEDIFKPFHTTKAKGTGLGLAITRKLVAQMGGTIWLDTNHAHGCSFVITLDAERPDPLPYSRSKLPTWRPR